jgi:hypothetical protein
MFICQFLGEEDTELNHTSITNATSNSLREVFFNTILYVNQKSKLLKHNQVQNVFVPENTV